MKHLYSGLRQLPFSIKAAAMIGQRLCVDPSFRKPIHLPWFAEKTTGPAVFRTFTLVICHGLRSRACRFLGDGDRSPSWQCFCGRSMRQHLFFGPACSVFLALYAMNFRGLFDPLYSRSEAILAQLKEVTSSSSRLFRASLTISSSCLAILSSIQSAPH
jgi:hypothetical protein